MKRCFKFKTYPSYVDGQTTTKLYQSDLPNHMYVRYIGYVLYIRYILDVYLKLYAQTHKLSSSLQSFSQWGMKMQCERATISYRDENGQQIQNQAG